MTNPNPALTGALRSPRTLAVWGLLGYTALYLFFAFFNWVLPGGGSFAARSAGLPFSDLFVMAFPVVAVLLAVHVQPLLAGSKLITAIALAEYAISLAFGALTFLIGLGVVFDGFYGARSGFNGLQYLIFGVAKLALIAIAGYAVFASFRSAGGTINLSSLNRSTPNPTAAATPPAQAPYPGGYDAEPPTQAYQHPPTP